MTKTSSVVIATLLCLQTAFRYVISTVEQYIYAYYLQTYTSSSNATQNLTRVNTVYLYRRLGTATLDSGECVNTTMNTSASNAELWAQEKSSNLLSRIDLWNSCPLVIMTYILGLYTPILGRRFVLILPMLGGAIQSGIWIAIINFHLPDYWWCVASAIVGLSGSDYVVSFVLNLIMTDSTNEHNRSTRFVTFESITMMAGAIVTFATGYYINWRGFTDLYSISLGLQVLSIVIVLLFIRNPSSQTHERSPLLSQANSSDRTETVQSVEAKKNCADIFQMFTIFRFKNRSNRKSISLLLILCSYIFYLLVYSTYSSFVWYVLDAPFCWSSEELGTYTAVSLVIYAIFSFIGMKVLTYLGADDIIICMFSHFCYAVSYLFVAFSKYKWQLYVVLFLCAYGEYPLSLTIPMMSKYLTVTERNHSYTLVAVLTTIILTFGSSTFNWIYSMTVHRFRNFILLLCTGFSVIGFILNVCLLVVARKIPREEQLIQDDTPESCLSTNNTNEEPNNIIDSVSAEQCLMAATSTEEDSQSNLTILPENKVV